MSKETDIDTIGRLVAARDAAVANADAEAALRPLARDVVVYDLLPPLAFVGDDARDAQALRALAGHLEGTRSTGRVPRVADRGRWRPCRRVWLQPPAGGGDKIGEGPVELWFRTTLVFARSADGWLVAHEHDSVPMEMDGSGLASVHLTP